MLPRENQRRVLLDATVRVLRRPGHGHGSTGPADLTSVPARPTWLTRPGNLKRPSARRATAVSAGRAARTGLRLAERGQQ
jgi:hypothetical protein